MVKNAHANKLNIIQIAKNVVATPARLGNCHLVLIDGPAGSGKTSLARFLQQELDAQVIHMDEMYDGWENSLTSATMNRIKKDILLPISEGKPAVFHKFNWLSYKFDETEVIEPSVLIVEGVGAASEGLREFANYIIWIEVNPDIGLERVLARDGREIEPQMIRWQKLEESWHKQDHARDFADLLLSGDRFELAPDEYLELIK